MRPRACACACAAARLAFTCILSVDSPARLAAFGQTPPSAACWRGSPAASRCLRVPASWSDAATIQSRKDCESASEQPVSLLPWRRCGRWRWLRGGGRCS